MFPSIPHRRIFLLFVFFLSVSILFAQNSFFELLSEDSIVRVKVATDLNKLVKEKKKPKYQKGEFTFLSGPLAGTSYEVKLKPRGNTRRTVCEYPPVKFKFSKSDLDFHKIKWVSVCQDNKKMQEKLLNEYLIYRLYGMLTDRSFRVRLLQLDFEGKKGSKRDRLSSYGFLIEPVKEVAHRTETTHYEPRYMKPVLLDRHSYPLLSVFQYLIGNTDWHIDNLHNLKFLRDSEAQAIVPVPYDFDYSGFVDAPYAVPHETIPVKNVRQRYNKAHCLTEEECKQICELFCSKKEEMLNYIENFDLLSERERKKRREYLEAGFDVLERKKWAKRIFVKNCDVCPQ